MTGSQRRPVSVTVKVNRKEGDYGQIVREAVRRVRQNDGFRSTFKPSVTKRALVFRRSGKEAVVTFALYIDSSCLPVL